MSKILLILGSGPRIGQATANKFVKAGYRVATASRSVRSNDDDQVVHYSVDLSDPASVQPVFDKIQKLWGAPSVVVYNAGMHVSTPDGFPTAPLEGFTQALNIGLTSAFAALRSAYALNPKVTFFYTGNCTDTKPLPGFGVQGISKVASAYMIKYAAEEKGRKGKFYYVDQRLENGEPAYAKVNGPAHADVFLRLAEQSEQEEPLVVFRAPAA